MVTIRQPHLLTKELEIGPEIHKYKYQNLVAKKLNVILAGVICSVIILSEGVALNSPETSSKEKQMMQGTIQRYVRHSGAHGTHFKI